MRFKIKDLDEPLHVKMPIQCRLCYNSLEPIKTSRKCTYCNTMKEAVKALWHLRMPSLNLGARHETITADIGGEYATSGGINQLPITSNSISRESGFTRMQNTINTRLY